MLKKTLNPKFHKGPKVRKSIRTKAPVTITDWRIHVKVPLAQHVMMTNENVALKHVLQNLVNMYIGSGEFISCITPKHRRDLSKTTPDQVWKAWDEAKLMLGESLEFVPGTSKPLKKTKP